jgi:hypothetical protein
VLFLLLGGEVDFDFGRAAGVGEDRIPALEVAGQVVVQDGGTDLGDREKPGEVMRPTADRPVCPLSRSSG